VDEMIGGTLRALESLARRTRRITGAAPFGERVDDRSSALLLPDEPPRTSAGGLPGARLRRVVAYVDANLDRALPLAELSSVVHMSRFHFARLFKARTGISPHRFVVRRRIEHAMTLLAEARSIDAVARTVGFRSMSHFTTTFRRIVGITPRRYRKLADHPRMASTATAVPTSRT
jgi:AraC-like DNA-binding protein